MTWQGNDELRPISELIGIHWFKLVRDLISNEDTPIKKLEKDIRENGQKHPILVLGNRVIHGQKRCVIQEHLGEDTISCYTGFNMADIQKKHEIQ